jgi:general secretion pathway protein K
MMHYSNQKGVALITVLMVVAIATFSMVSIAYRLQLDIRRTENTLYYGQALQISKLAEHLAKKVIIDDSDKNKRDDLGEDWATVKDQKIVFEDIPVTAEITDLQGRFNLNNLNQDGAAGVEARKQFRRLLTTLQIQQPLQNTIADYIDANSIPLSAPGAAEDSDYQNLEIAYLPANKDMISPSELRLMFGISKEDYETLLPYITTLPKVTLINVNTASPEVLSSIAKGFPKGNAEGILSGRPFDDVAQFTGNEALAGLKVNEKLLSVTTDYFLFESTVFYGHIEQKQQVIFERQDGEVRSIMRAEGEL